MLVAERDGVGMGLPIYARIVELHAGRLALANQSGLEARIVLPVCTS